MPAGLVAAGTALLLAYYGIPLTTTAVFATYLVVGVVVPGTLLWRLCSGRGSFVVDVAAGTALGYAVEVLAYLPARAAGAPYLVLVWPVATIGAFALVRNLRMYWRSAPDADRAPAGWSWSTAAAVALLVFWSVKFFRVHGLSWPGYRTPDTDSPFHLALLGEAKHHLPMATPWLSGEPLYYHWFVYAEMAATSWVTGIEPQFLLLRLAMLPMLAGFTVLIGVLARTLFGPWWTGVAAVVGTLFVLAPAPYGWPRTWFDGYFAFSPFEDGSSLRMQLWTSPTQTFGALLFAGLVLALIGILRAGGGRRWVVFAVLLCAVSGAKATYLPLLLAGLLAVAVLRRRGFLALGMTFGALLFAQLVLFGGTSQGLGWDPLATMKIANAAAPTGFLDDPRPWRLALVCLLTVAGWLCVWSGIAGLRSLTVEMVLLLGIGAAALGAVLLLGQSGGSQGFFLQSARPYLTLAAVGGLATLLRRINWRVIVAVVAGELTVELVRLVGRSSLPTGSPRGVALDLTLPFVALAVSALVVIAALRQGKVTPWLAIGVCVLAGMGLSGAVHNFGGLVRESAAHGWRDVPTAGPSLTRGTLEAGRWLRDHSGPDDLVATNAHCLVVTADGCTNLHFSVAAYTERRLLVEGWGFTTTAHVRAAELRTWVGFVPYWRPEVLAANDAAFTDPSAETVDRLRDRYGVRWLFADETQPGYDPHLADVARLRYRSGACVVFELAGTP